MKPYDLIYELFSIVVVVIVTVLRHYSLNISALCWLSALHITLHWLSALHIALRRLPDLIMPIVGLPSLAPNNSVLHLKGSKPGNQTGCRIATPELAPSPTYRAVLAPYTRSQSYL